MAQLIEIWFENPEALFEDGNRFFPGEKIPMGVGALKLELDGRTITRYSARGNINYQTELTKEGKWRFGPSFGHRIKDSAEERDPILRILREFGVPMSRLERMQVDQTEVPYWETDWCHGSLAVPKTSTKYLTDGEMIEVSVDHGSKQEPRTEREGTIRNPSFIIRVAKHGDSCAASDPFEPAEVQVWPHLDPRDLADTLARNRHGDDADYTFFKAVKRKGIARYWMEQKKGWELLLGWHERELSLISVARELGIRSSLPALLARIHGAAIIRTSNPDVGQFLNAFDSVKSAVEFLAKRFHLEVSEGERQGVVLTKPNQKGRRYSAWLPLDGSNWCRTGYGLHCQCEKITALEALSRVHGKNLKEELYNFIKRRGEISS